MKKICLHCKKIYEINTNNQKYCCKKCQQVSDYHRKYQKNYRKQYKSLIRLNRKVNIIMRNCLRCEKKFKAIGKFHRICNYCKRENGKNNIGLYQS